MRIVVDTNVIASAIFFGGKPYQLLHYIMEGRVDVVASKEIVDEYEEIVLRLKQKYPRIDTRIPLQELLSKFEIIRVSSDIQASRDPDDNKFISCAVDGKCFWQMLEKSFLFLHKIIVRWKQKSLTFKNGYLLAEEVSGNPTTTRQTTP